MQEECLKRHETMQLKTIPSITEYSTMLGTLPALKLMLLIKS